MNNIRPDDPRLIEITELANHVLRAVNKFKPSSRRLCVDALSLVVGQLVQAEDGLTPDQAASLILKACEPIERVMN
jgi:hypothetical protein